MKSYYHVRGTLKHGHNLYSIHYPDGRKLVGLSEQGPAIIACQEMNRMLGQEEPSYDELEKMIWCYSNGIYEPDCLKELREAGL